MKYEKPELIVLGSAAVAIQGGPNSKPNGPNDTSHNKPTAGAYEADE
jgi:hypothetical protein